MPFSYLDDDELRAIRDAATDAGLVAPDARSALLDGIYPRFRNALRVYNQPALQIVGDLRALNDVERLVDGSVPLEIWLRNAVDLTTQESPAEVFKCYLDRVASVASGEPEPPSVDAIGEIEEAIIHRDDTLPYGFLAGGAQAGLAVAHLRVYPYSGETRGAQPFLGTGWLIARDLIVTNHHVVQARLTHQPPPMPEELTRQGAAAEAYFDYLADEQLGPPVRCTGMVAAHAGLDYAILRLEQAVDPAPLRISGDRLKMREGEYRPVNILQHPQGGPKKVALRNNLLTAATDNELRYFTDTRPGSSGAPILDDAWRVVGLHRGSRLVQGVKFQGKSTAYVNFGTQLQAILEDLRVAAPIVAGEIPTIGS